MHAYTHTPGTGGAFSKKLWRVTYHTDGSGGIAFNFQEKTTSSLTGAEPIGIARAVMTTCFAIKPFMVVFGGEMGENMSFLCPCM
jgi:hypothetical protein